MQIGTRWRVGETPPQSVPEALHAALTAVELSSDPERLAGQFWTLTWQERLPTCRLDSGRGLTMLRDGSIVSVEENPHPEDDDWLKDSR